MKIYIKTLAVFYVSRIIFSMIEILLSPDAITDAHLIMAAFPAAITAVVYVLEYQRTHKEDDVIIKDTNITKESNVNQTM